MKKFLFMLLCVVGMTTAAFAQLTAGFYGGDQTINFGETTFLEFRFTGDGPVAFSFSDGAFPTTISNVTSSPYFLEVSPSSTTRYELTKVKNAFGFGDIEEEHRFITVYVGNGNNTVSMNFTPPNVCLNGDPVNLSNYLWSNVTPSQTWYQGDGVQGNIFYPYLAGIGSHSLEAFISYNGLTYSVRHNITVYEMPQVSLWLPSEAFDNDPPFVLSGGRPSGGFYWGDGVLNGNVFDPGIAGVGWHTLYYSYTTPNGCQDVAECKIYVRRSGNDVEETLEDSFVVYPNPTNGIVNFTKPCAVDIYSTVSLIRRENSLVESIDNSDLSEGVYILKLFDGENIFARRIVRE